MPTYLVHGFRWQRSSIRVHIILQDLDDAAPEWVVAPATSVTLLNSFYSLFDFLPPSNPPPASYPLFVPTEKVIVEDDDTGPRSLSKKNKGSNASLDSAARKCRPAKLNGAGLGKGMNGAEVENGYHVSERSESDVFRTTPETSTSREIKGKSGKKPMFNDWSVVKFVEQYDPNDLNTVSQSYAYVGDYVVEVTLSASISEEVAKYEARQRKEEAPLITSTPGTSGTPAVGASGDLTSAGLSAREIRRKSRRLGWFEKLRDQLQKGAVIGWYVVVCGDEERASPSMEMERTSEDTEEEDPMRAPKSAGLRGFFNRKKNIPEEE